MANRKQPSKRPQRKHKAKSIGSRHDKRSRLNLRNPLRRITSRAIVPLMGVLASLVGTLQSVLDPRNGFRLAIIVSGMLLAGDRRTASAWFAAGGVTDDWDRFYDFLISLGRQAQPVAESVLKLIVQKVNPGKNGRLVLAVDDSPTARYGKHVEGAGVHHNPTAGPADGEFLYGHNWVSLACVTSHPFWGTIALPIRSLLYVRKVDIPALDARHGWKFQTKHQLAVDLVIWCVATLHSLDCFVKVWVVADGAYAAIPFLKPLLKMGVTVVSRLRRDAKLFDLPPRSKSKHRGRPRVYGTNRIVLAKRASHPQGWESITYQCRGHQVTREYKSFLATTKLTSGQIRVVLVRYDNAWAPYFCTDTTATVREILEAVADRWAIEEHFHDVKEVCGAGQQQVRNVWSNIGCWNLNQWLCTLVEIASWNSEQARLADRSDRPWDNPDRRPSHADKRKAIVREMLHGEFLNALPNDLDPKELKTRFETLVKLCL